MSSTSPIPEADARLRVGVLGAGQLGRMLALAGQPLGCSFVFVDPNPDAPAGALGEQIVCDWLDPNGLERLAQTHVVTYEFESVPVEAAELLAKRVPVFPPPGALRVAQDRVLEKNLFRELEIPTAPFQAVSSRSELEQALAAVGTPAVLKTRRLGYDGKGQFVIASASQADAAWAAVHAAPSILEGFVRFERELSVLVVRGQRGEMRFYPPVENVHRAGILRTTFAPAPTLDNALRDQAEAYAGAIATRLDYVGVLALELFLDGGTLRANEIAPRVHNSGHFSIEGSRTSQFENHLRAILDLPLGATDCPEPCAMLNLIGALPTPEAVLAVPDAHLHVYGKCPRPGRKVGHITVRAPTQALLLERVRALREIPGVE